MTTLNRGPESERIEGGDPTFRVEIEHDGHSMAVPDCELMEREEAVRMARYLRENNAMVDALRVVNERTGFTVDEWRRDTR